MPASDFEFKYRFWIFAGLFCMAFALYNVDHQNAGAALAEWVARQFGQTAHALWYHAVFAVAAFCCVLAAAIRTWGTAYLNPEVMSDARLHTSKLVADGPYRHVRNPLYFGNIFLAIGFGLMASRLGFALLVIGIPLFDRRLIQREEAALAQVHPESFRSYCAAVPRIVPSLRPRVAAGQGTADWRGGFLGEAFMWVLALSVTAYSITLNLKVYFVILILAFAVYGVCLAAIKRPKNARGASAGGQRP